MSRARRIGKYRLVRRLGRGGFADVYRAYDTIEGIHVALKVPGPELQSKERFDELRHEIRVASRLDHPNVLPLKNADFVDGRFVMAYPLGVGTLAERLTRRLALDTSLSYAEQLLEGLAHAHSRRVMHCDVKPENMILFADGTLRLADFGIAKVARRTLHASGSGTVGYLAPEQALGRPSFRSDVFAAGLVLYRMFSGRLPHWPYEWPMVGDATLRRKLSGPGIELLVRALQVDHRRRFRDARAMLGAFRRVLPRIRRPAGRPRANAGGAASPDWSEMRRRAYLARHRGAIALRDECARCTGPLGEEMFSCPWCGTARARRKGKASFPATCGRCGRGRKLDWRSCAWCYGGSFREVADRSYPDKRYAGRCSGCRGQVMPFTRYCPWCRRKLRRAWKPEGARQRCAKCGWGVFPEYWDHCPWCGGRTEGRR